MKGWFKMIQVFCDKRGCGKTKNLILLANGMADNGKGDIVYIDDDKRPLFELKRKIRFISTSEYDLEDCDSFYGLLCGILSENYDVDTIFVDGLFNIVKCNPQDAAHLFCNLEKLSQSNNVNFYININGDNELPEFIKKYVA